MIINASNLPTEATEENISFLHNLVLDLSNKVLKLESHLERMKLELKLLKKKRFGKSSEKLDRKIAELELKIEEEEQKVSTAGGDILEEEEDSTDFNTSEKRGGRNPLPDHLPREDELIKPDPLCPSCGSAEFKKISDDITETLEYRASSFIVKRTIRPRCACKICEKIVQAEVPSKPIAKGKAGASMLAHILVQKYCYHLPLYRQSQIYEYEGVSLSRTTLASWAGECCKLLAPLITCLGKYVFASSEIHGDDTPVRVLAPGAAKTKRGRIWVYVKDGRPHSDASAPAAIYYYSPDRKGIRPEAHLKDFKGVLHADAYSGYNKVYEKDKNGNTSIFEASCWAHTRRKFYEVTAANDNASIAEEACKIIGKIYKIEREIKGLPPKERLKVRQEKSEPIVSDFFEWLKKVLGKLPAKGVTALAINYALNNEDSLKRFLTDGKIEIDNNAAERALRGVAVGRKNWLFAGSDAGGNTAAGIYSLIESAKMNGVNPYQYLYKVLNVIQDYNCKKLDELLPWNIKLDPS